jgi:hypothetical protein
VEVPCPGYIPSSEEKLMGGRRRRRAPVIDK